MSNLLVADISTVEEELLLGSRPVHVNARTGRVLVNSARGIQVNSLLKEDEWRQIDADVMEAARQPLRALADLRVRGLTKPLGGLGTMISNWYTRSEMTPATVSMSGQGSQRDLPDMKMAGVPVPIFAKEFAIDLRTLLASRRMGDGLDTTSAVEATRVVAEAMDDIVISGNTGIVVNGATIYGYRTHPDRNTNTATTYGGGDWGTLAYIVPTVEGMINAANDDRHYGPFHLYVAQTQYNQAALKYYDDGSSDKPIDRILGLPPIAGVSMLPQLADGELLLVSMTRETVEWAEAMDIQVREWATPDGMTSIFRVMACGTPRIKSRYGNQSGIVHATGA
jgi:uncharacterized linocin/CFP29 family protein